MASLSLTEKSRAFFSSLVQEVNSDILDLGVHDLNTFSLKKFEMMARYFGTYIANIDTIPKFNKK